MSTSSSNISFQQICKSITVQNPTSYAALQKFHSTIHRLTVAKKWLPRIEFTFEACLALLDLKDFSGAKDLAFMFIDFICIPRENKSDGMNAHPAKYLKKIETIVQRFHDLFDQFSSLSQDPLQYTPTLTLDTEDPDDPYSKLTPQQKRIASIVSEFLNMCISWTIRISKNPSGTQGYPPFHRLLALHHLKIGSRAVRFITQYLYSENPVELAHILFDSVYPVEIPAKIQFSKLYHLEPLQVSDMDYVVTWVVTQYLLLSNVRDARIFLDSFLKFYRYHAAQQISQADRPTVQNPYLTSEPLEWQETLVSGAPLNPPLMNFSNFLLLLVPRRTVLPLYKFIQQNYLTIIKKYPTLSLVLDRVAEKYFGNESEGQLGSESNPSPSARTTRTRPSQGPSFPNSNNPNNTNPNQNSPINPFQLLSQLSNGVANRPQSSNGSPESRPRRTNNSPHPYSSHTPTQTPGRAPNAANNSRSSSERDGSRSDNNPHHQTTPVSNTHARTENENESSNSPATQTPGVPLVLNTTATPQNPSTNPLGGWLQLAQNIMASNVIPNQTQNNTETPTSSANVGIFPVPMQGVDMNTVLSNVQNMLSNPAFLQNAQMFAGSLMTNIPTPTTPTQTPPYNPPEGQIFESDSEEETLD